MVPGSGHARDSTPESPERERHAPRPRHGRPHPSVAAIRYAVRTALDELSGHELTEDSLVLAAVSGGADSLALAESLAFESRRTGRPAGALVVDHGLQDGSAEVANRAALTCRELGLDPVEVLTVTVSGSGSGLEAAARDARYAALESRAEELGAAAVLLGHTQDDQAEQVLLGLTRGSGTRSLSGMPASRGRFVRPLLGVTREQTREACAAEGITFWDDPMNDDPRFTRVRARRALADLERDLGPGIGAALARSAEQLRADADLLDVLAGQAREGLPDAPPYPVEALAAIPTALRGRVWRMLLVEAGAPAGSLGATHTDSCDLLLTRWRGQGPLHLPGDLRVSRETGRIHVRPVRRVE